MNIATILVTGVHAHTSNSVIVPQGIVGASVTFDFEDPLWEGLSKTAVFQGNVTRDVIVKGNTAIIPAETVANEGTTLKVGVYGVDDKNNLAIPTLWATIGKIGSAADPSGDPGTDPDLPIWAQLADEVDRLKRTDTYGGGLDAESSALLITILRNAIYGTNQSANITLLETVLSSGGGGSSGDDGSSGGGGSESGVWYRVTNVLTNVINSNAAVTVAENGMYIATFTANEGYAIDSVTVTMGGVDITATVYSGGAVTIPSVTGDIVLTASAVEVVPESSYIQNGLLYEFTNLTTARTIPGGQSIFNSENDFTLFASFAGKAVVVVGIENQSNEFFFHADWQGKFISQVYLTDSSRWPQISFSPSDMSGEKVYRSCIVKSGNSYSLYVDGETNPVRSMGSDGKQYILNGDLAVNKNNKQIDKMLIYNRALSAEEISKNFTTIRQEVGE